MWEPVLSGASMVRAGWLDSGNSGKLVIYPIRGQVLTSWGLRHNSSAEEPRALDDLICLLLNAPLEVAR